MNTTNHWQIAQPLTPAADENLAAFPPILRQILFNRGIATQVDAEAYLRAESLLESSPFLMKGMQAGVERLKAAIQGHERVVIYGDYDVDGVTATALLLEVIRALGGDAHGYIPNRFEEGYGLNKEALDLLARDGSKLVISVDCGIRSPEEARHARTLGLDLIITDHHEPAGEMPEALAIINPKQAGDTYPEKYLAGVGIAYKMAQGLLESFQPAGGAFQLEDVLDLVALGTVADLAPLTGENRALVRAGLRQMGQNKRQGLYSLANVAGVSLARVNAMNIGFALGPRLNAAGRLESAMAALELLTTTEVATAGRLAQQLDEQNRARQVITRKIQEQAEQIAAAGDPAVPILFAVDEGFNAGVVGLAAARLVESHYRPAVVGERGSETTRCSCRSIPEFHITAALDECADLLVRHGGHAAAAGFTVRNENLEPLKERLMDIARRELAGLDLRKTLVADLVLHLGDLRADLLKNLESLQPTGYGNPEAVFVSRSLAIRSARTVGADARHLKLVLEDGRVSMNAIGFRLAGRFERMPERVDALYTFELNEYNGQTSFQMNLRDIKAAGTPD
jgi:single-stranded-DNA-specific exonuclease